MGHKREQKTKEIFEARAKEHMIKQSKTPSFHCRQTNLAAPVDKQLRNKSTLFVFTEVRTHCQTRQEVLFLQTTCSQQVARGDETQGWKSNHSIRSSPATWDGSHATVRSCPGPFVSGLTCSHQDTPGGCLLFFIQSRNRGLVWGGLWKY